ncbi:hypothetical protein VP14_204 [Vibrio phage VPMCC14]|nr:hypothetical protein VP14_204 [Vibrio phage VPMCC14]
MGVLACDREGCENIMCDYISHERGEYLCWECKRELIEKGFCDIDEFMGREKKPRNNQEAWEDYVNSVFKSMYEEE